MSFHRAASAFIRRAASAFIGRAAFWEKSGLATGARMG